MDEKLRIDNMLQGSFLRQYLEDNNITDINFDGDKISLKHNERGTIIATEKPDLKDVQKFIKQVADMKDKEFTVEQPILDTEVGFLRLNAIHNSVSPDGDTFSLRVSRPNLALDSIESAITSDNEETKRALAELLRIFMKADINLIISGATGAGKTELQKLLVGAIDDKMQIFLVEDTRDSHIKQLYPEKCIKSYRTLTSDDRKHKITTAILVRAGLRNFPNWLIISETRGEEAADMLEAARTNHSVITTLHSSGAMDSPSRLKAMISKADEFKNTSDVMIGKDLTKYLQVGVHLDIEETADGVVRGIKELAVFTGYNEAGTEGEFIYRRSNRYNLVTQNYDVFEELNPLPDVIRAQIEDKRLIHEVPPIFLQEVAYETQVS